MELKIPVFDHAIGLSNALILKLSRNLQPSFILYKGTPIIPEIPRVRNWDQIPNFRRKDAPSTAITQKFTRFLGDSSQGPWAEIKYIFLIMSYSDTII